MTCQFELHDATTVGHGSGCGFQDADHPQPGVAVGQRCPALLDARDELLQLDAERLGDLQLGRPHVPGTVADEHLILRLAVLRRRAVHRDALVVDLDLLARLQIVVDDHLAASADQCPPHLDRRQPVHVDMRDQVGGEEHGQIGDVLRLAGEVRQAGRRDRHRLLTGEDVVHDRQVVDGQVPDHVDIVLEEAEVDPRRVVVIDLPQIAGLDQLAHLANRAGVDEGVVDADHQIAASRLRRSAAAPASASRSSASR